MVFGFLLVVEVVAAWATAPPKQVALGDKHLRLIQLTVAAEAAAEAAAFTTHRQARQVVWVEQAPVAAAQLQAHLPLTTAVQVVALATPTLLVAVVVAAGTPVVAELLAARAMKVFNVTTI